MALPTPGYNPETSLLQGGTAPIVPVQGGGGGTSTIPPDYNPSASLLQGGTGVIEPIRGGGKEGVRFANVLEERREYSEEAATTNVSRMSRAYTLEVYDIRVEGTTLAIDSDKAARQRRLLNYVNAEKQTKLVTSVGAYEAGGLYTSYPKYGDCKPSLPVNYFVERARKVHFMDDKPHIIWLIPNIRGNKQVYETIFDKLVNEKYELAYPNVVLIFTGSFYPETPNDDSIFLFDELMKLKEKNPGRVFVVTPTNATLLKNGCHILEQMYGKSSLLKEGKSRLVPTFFEPDILVFPHERFLVRSCDMPISAEPKVSVGLLVKKKVNNKSYYIQPKLTVKSDPEPLEKYVTVLSNPNQSETVSWPPKAQQTIKCPKDSDCQHFEVGFPLAALGESIVLNFLDTKLYLFHITKERIPYLTGPKEEGNNEETVEEEEEEEEEEEVDVTPVEEEVIPPKPLLVKKPKRITGFYKESPAAKSSEKTVTFDLGPYTFTIRVPKSHIQSDAIRVDWLNEVFTKDEALLLNALQLTPTLMKQAFGEMYKWRLSTFLASLTYSSCFKETSLLLASECEDARRFLRKVSALMEKECLETFYKNLGTPVKGTLEILTAEVPAPSAAAVPSSPVLQGLTLPFSLLDGLRGLSLEEEVPASRRLVAVTSTPSNSNVSLISDILTATGADGEELHIGDHVNCGDRDNFGFIYGFKEVDGTIYAVSYTNPERLLRIERKIDASKCKKTIVTPPTPPILNRFIQKAYGTPKARSLINDLNGIAASWKNLRLEPFDTDLAGLTVGLRNMSLFDFSLSKSIEDIKRILETTMMEGERDDHVKSVRGLLTLFAGYFEDKDTLKNLEYFLGRLLEEGMDKKEVESRVETFTTILEQLIQENYEDEERQRAIVNEISFFLRKTFSPPA